MGVYLSGPNIRILVPDSLTAMKLLTLGNCHRSLSAASLHSSSGFDNSLSSRGHSILTLHVESKNDCL